MARVQGFYNTATWQKCRALYIKSVGGLCEMCYKNGIIRHGDTVHHIIHITEENVNDPNIALNPDNLILLCRDHHAQMHRGVKRYKVDSFGKVEARE